MFWRTKFKLVALITTIGTAAVSCAGRGTPAPGTHETERVQLEVFEFLVETYSRSFRVSLTVDPRPIAPERQYLSVDDTLPAMREEALRLMGVPQASIFPFRTDCTFALAPLPVRDLSGCPEQGESVLGIGWAKFNEIGAQWTVPVLIASYEPIYGRTATWLEVVLVKRGGEWRIENSIEIQA